MTVITHDNWFDGWTPETEYLNEVEGVDTAITGSPIGKSGIICGPTLRFVKIDKKEDGRVFYTASMLIVSKNVEEMPNVKFVRGLANESDEDENQLTMGFFKGKLFHLDILNEDKYYFFRYNCKLEINEKETMIKYMINGNWERHYRFYIPGIKQNCNIMAYSCNGFSLGVDTTRFKGSLWLDVLRNHSNYHYHAMMGGGDQLYSDQIVIRCEPIKEWINTKDPIKKHKIKVDEKFNKQLDNFYLEEYLEWYGYGHWHGKTDKSNTTQRLFPKAMSSIPHINIWDDHDIIDGFGSYNDKFMNGDVFKAIGKSAYRYYMIFQHHVSCIEKDEDKDAYINSSHWLLGQRGKFIGEYSHSVYTSLGPNMAMLGLDCRTERRLHEICSKNTYDLVFDRLNKEAEKGNGEIKHLLVMLGVPIAYPRLVWLEWMFTSPIFAPLKYLSKKGIIAKGLVNDFNGDVELLDDLNDHWCAHNHKAERNYLLSKLQDYSGKYGIRVTILSGDVHLASMGRFYTTGSKIKPEEDPRLCYNVIASAITNIPPPDAMPKLLQQRSKKGHKLDKFTKEDTVELFKKNCDGTDRLTPGFYNRRNYSEVIPLNQDKEAQSDELYVSIHVETDENDIKSHTTPYSINIPALHVSGLKMEHTGMKHLTEYLAPYEKH